MRTSWVAVVVIALDRRAPNSPPSRSDPTLSRGTVQSNVQAIADAMTDTVPVTSPGNRSIMPSVFSRVHSSATACGGIGPVAA